MGNLYRYYVLIMITVVSMINIADRLIMSILMHDIKADFQLSDTRVGLLVGLAFALFYALMSFPIARWACLLYTSPSPRDRTRSRMPSSA